MARQAWSPQADPMPAALPLALLMLADGAAYGPAAPAAKKAPEAKVAADDGCANAQSSGNSREIVICAQRPNGYRLDPDVMEARKEKREANAGRLKNPGEKARISSCGVGPQPCGTPGINILAAAMTAVEMAKRLAAGKEIGSMFETTPEPNEYQLYLQAKHRREQREAQAKAEAIARAAQAKAAAPTAKP
jgi:hypothetical protein